MKITPPVHPGEILREEFLKPLNLSAYALAARLNVPRTRIERLVTQKTPISADTALRLSRYLGTSAQFWMNLQSAYDLTLTEDERQAELEQIAPRAA